MCDRETVGLALYALEEGMTQRETAELCGVSRASVGFWAAERVPHERGVGGIRVDGRAWARDAGCHVTTTLTNHLTADEADNSASYITGYNLARRDNTDMAMWIYLVAPAGGSISNVSQEGGDAALQDFTELPYNGLSVTFANPRIDGGETMTVTYAVTCAAGAAPMTVRTTPTAQSVAGWE